MQLCSGPPVADLSARFRKLLTTRLLTQEHQITKPVSTLKTFYGRRHDIVYPYHVAASRINSDVFATDKP